MIEVAPPVEQVRQTIQLFLLPFAIGLIHLQSNSSSFSLDGKDNVVKPVFVEICHRNRPYLTMDGGELRFGHSAVAVTVTDGDQTRCAGTADNIRVPVIIHICNYNRMEFTGKHQTGRIWTLQLGR